MGDGIVPNWILQIKHPQNVGAGGPRPYGADRQM